MGNHPEFTALWCDPEDAVKYADVLNYVQFPVNVDAIHRKLTSEKYQYLGDVVSDFLLIVNNSTHVNSLEKCEVYPEKILNSFKNYLTLKWIEAFKSLQSNIRDFQDMFMNVGDVTYDLVQQTAGRLFQPGKVPSIATQKKLTRYPYREEIDECLYLLLMLPDDKRQYVLQQLVENTPPQKGVQQINFEELQPQLFWWFSNSIKELAGSKLQSQANEEIRSMRQQFSSGGQYYDILHDYYAKQGDSK